MANTYSLLASTVLTGTQATVTFSSIPNNYTDLLLKFSARSTSGYTGGYDDITVIFNSDTAGNYSETYLWSNGTSPASGKSSGNTSIYNTYNVTGSTATANTFSNSEIYIPSYTSSLKKQISFLGTSENNNTSAIMGIDAGLWQGTVAITSITLNLISGGNFVSGSSFYLYGIKNA